MDRFACPNCQVETYYFDGEKLTCPSCPQDDFMSALHDSEGCLEYQELIKHDSPFFKLDLGRTYTCDVKFEDKAEKTEIIPITYSSKSNKLFFIFGGNFVMSKYPDFVEVMLQRDFDEIWDDVVLNKNEEEKIDYPSLTMTTIGTTNSENTIINTYGFIFTNFEIQNSKTAGNR